VFIKQKRCILKARLGKRSGITTQSRCYYSNNPDNFPSSQGAIDAHRFIKLADETKRRLDNLAASQGVKSHALMVRAIESTLSNAEQQQSFVAAALRARQTTVQTGLVIDGPAFGDYLKARVRGVKTVRPGLQPIDALATKTA